MQVIRKINAMTTVDRWWTIVRLDPGHPWEMWAVWSPLGIPLRAAVCAWDWFWLNLQRPTAREKDRMRCYSAGVKWCKKAYEIE